MPENAPHSAGAAEIPASLLHDNRFFFNRELSWLEFNRRVLQEAQDSATPLLERLKFLSIFSTNLDEFFMIRVSGLKEQIAEGVAELSADGMSPDEQMRAISETLRPMLGDQMACLHQEVLPGLAANGITIWNFSGLSPSEQESVSAYFMENVFPVLTPQAVDASHPFPYISNLSLNLGLTLKPDEDQANGFSEVFSDELRFARVKLPPSISRLILVNDSGNKFCPLGELIAAHARFLFPGMKVVESHLFRVTRDADLEIREDEAGDLLRTMEQELRRRRFRFPVRLEVAASMPEEMADYLTRSIGLTAQDVYRIDGFLGIPDLMQLYGLQRPDLKDKPIALTTPVPLRQHKSIFEAVKQGDILLHHPYTAYTAVTDFINAAAEDPDVQAIKICLYRTGKDSPVIRALMRASQHGKQVAALVELKARFDEENNIEWARRLEAEGVHVVYGMRGLKTHCKVALVIRREAGRLVRYVHLATGNYNPTTSKIYTDLGILTCDPEIGADATDLFNFLTGYSRQTKYRQMLVAPVSLRLAILAMIRRETTHAQNGQPARIIVKVNSLTDVKTIQALYEASSAGAQIDLIVRGICALRPGIVGLSENIRVRSIVGRFLEHSRIFYFANGGQSEVYIGSADWMQRNLDRRIEVICPVRSARIADLLRYDVLESYLKDDKNARLLLPDGRYELVSPSEGESPFDSQMYFVGQDY